MRRGMKTNSGFSLVELMVAVGVGTIVSLSMASLIADMTRANANMRANMDYINFAAEIKAELNTSVPCQEIFGTVRYTGSEKASIPQFKTRNGPTYTPQNEIRGTNLQLEGLFLAPSQDPPSFVDMVDPQTGGQVTLQRYGTKLQIVARRRGEGAPTLRPIEIPITVFTASEEVRLCSASDMSNSCRQMGGVFVPGNPLDNPPTTDRCDILPAFGGCAKGGQYSQTNGQCSSHNAYTGTCGCPAGFTAQRTAAFQATKEASFVQFECLRCTNNTNPIEGDNSAPMPILEDYMDDQFFDELCKVVPSSCHVCRRENRQSRECACQADPDDPQCADFGGYCEIYGAGSCPCAESRANTACENNPSSQECAMAMQNAFMICNMMYLNGYY